MGIKNPEKALTMSDIVRSDDCLFVASVITDGTFLKGIKENEMFASHSFVGNSKDNFINLQDSSLIESIWQIV